MTLRALVTSSLAGFALWASFESPAWSQANPLDEPPRTGAEAFGREMARFGASWSEYQGLKAERRARLAELEPNAVLDVIEEESLCERATAIGEKVLARLHAIARRQGMEVIGDIRGRGAVIAFELVSDRVSKAPDAQLASRFVAEAEKRGLISLVCGTRFNVIRLLPALTIPDAILAEGLDILEAALEVAVRLPCLA